MKMLNTKIKKGDTTMKLEREYIQIAGLLQVKFSSKLSRKEPVVVEVIMILVMSLLLGWDTVNEVAKRLGLSKDELYNQLKGLTVQKWRELFRSAFEQLAEERLLEVQGKSDSTWSRLEVLLSIDNSVVRKWGKILSYLGKWWSGQFHRVLNGHDVLMVVLKIGKEVMPVSFWVMSKKGPVNSKVERTKLMIGELAKYWSSKGIELSKIAVSMDAWFNDNELIKAIKEAGFEKIVMGAKGNYRLHPGRAKKQSVTLSSVMTKEDFPEKIGWAESERVILKKGTSPTFGEVTVLARFMLGKVRRVFAFGIYRACEILRIWKAHHWIEEVFKRLKHLLSWGSYRLRGRAGAYATIVIALLAYFLLLVLQRKTGCTFAQLITAIEQWALLDIDDLLHCWSVEHFHLALAATNDILKI